MKKMGAFFLPFHISHLEIITILPRREKNMYVALLISLQRKIYNNCTFLCRLELLSYFFFPVAKVNKKFRSLQLKLGEKGNLGEKGKKTAW